MSQQNYRHSSVALQNTTKTGCIFSDTHCFLQSFEPKAVWSMCNHFCEGFKRLFQTRVSVIICDQQTLVDRNIIKCWIHNFSYNTFIIQILASKLELYAILLQQQHMCYWLFCYFVSGLLLHLLLKITFVEPTYLGIRGINQAGSQCESSSVK